MFGIPENIVQDFVTKRNFIISNIKEFVTKEATQSYSYKKVNEYINKGNYKGNYFGGE